MKEIRTKRLLLRPFRESDYDETVCCLYHQKKDFISVPYEPKNADYLRHMK